jgi:hypothetical protein
MRTILEWKSSKPLWPYSRIGDLYRGRSDCSVFHDVNDTAQPQQCRRFRSGYPSSRISRLQYVSFSKPSAAVILSERNVERKVSTMNLENVICSWLREASPDWTCTPINTVAVWRWAFNTTFDDCCLKLLLAIGILPFCLRRCHARTNSGNICVRSNQFQNHLPIRETLLVWEVCLLLKRWYIWRILYNY